MQFNYIWELGEFIVCVCVCVCVFYFGFDPKFSYIFYVLYFFFQIITYILYWVVTMDLVLYLLIFTYLALHAY